MSGIERVIQTLAPLVLKGGHASRGKEIFKKERRKCHSHSGEGGKVGPDLTGMAAHPRSELIIHIRNFLQYTVSTTDGRILSGLLASGTRTSIDLLDAEGKKQTILREDIEELAASKKSLMPEGFEKTVPPQGLADLLQFLTQKGKYLPLDLHKVATLTTTEGVPFGPGGAVGRLRFEDWGPKVVDGVPFALVAPQGERQPNAIMLGGPSGRITPRMPRSVTLPVNAPARAIHLLSGVAGLGYPVGREGTISMIVHIKYEDGTTEDHEAEEWRALRRRQRRAGRPGLEAGIPARRAAGPLPDRYTQEEGFDRQHRSGERARLNRADRPGRVGRGLRVIVHFCRGPIAPTWEVHR